MQGNERSTAGDYGLNGQNGLLREVERHDRLPAPVGVFDSGLGGLTVAREILRQMPGTPILYVADTAHVPYGPRPAGEIRAFAHGIIDALLDAGAGAVVAACNMSSALALPHLYDHYPVPLVGMIHPGVNAALEVAGDGPLGVLATEGTCNSGAYPRRAQELRPGMAVHQMPCPEFVPLVESGRTEGPEAFAAAERYLSPLLDAGCKTVILGCTHYPWLLPVLMDLAGPGVKFVDPAQAAVEALIQRMGRPAGQGSAPAHRFASTAFPERLEAGVRHWLGLELTAEYWPLWESETVRPPAEPALSGT